MKSCSCVLCCWCMCQRARVPNTIPLLPPVLHRPLSLHILSSRGVCLRRPFRACQVMGCEGSGAADAVAALLAFFRGTVHVVFTSRFELFNSAFSLSNSIRSSISVNLQRALLSDLDKGNLLGGKDASAPRCLARPGNTATNNEWRLSPNGWKDEQRIGRWTEVAFILL